MALSIQELSGGHTIYGLSTDTKPTKSGISNGDIFIEMDTMHAYFWDAENKKWLKVQ